MLHLTKIAFGCSGIADLAHRLAARRTQGDGLMRLATRHRPKRALDLVGGSLFWIHESTFIGRTPLIGFDDRDDGRVDIVMQSCLIPVHPTARRPHQGWRYLEADDAPLDLDETALAPDALPAPLERELVRLGLL